MRSILRDPGAEVIVGLLSFSVSFVGIGLAIAALDGRSLIPCYSYVAFGLATLLFIGALIATILLFRHFAKTKGYIWQTGLYLRQGYILRQAILDVKTPLSLTPELKEKVSLWHKDVQQWLDCYLSDYAPDFQLETLTSTPSWFTYEDVSKEVCSAALRLESKLANLRGILSDIRR
jgi:hypothetical protein